MRTRRSVLTTDLEASTKPSNSLDVFNMAPTRGVRRNSKGITPIAVTRAALEPSTAEPAKSCKENVQNRNKKTKRRTRNETRHSNAKKRRHSINTTPLRRRENQLCPISKLGDEELLQVFTLVKDMASSEEDPCRLVLPLVCKRWANLLRCPSSIWKNMKIQTMNELLDLHRVNNWVQARSNSIESVQIDISIEMGSTYLPNATLASPCRHGSMMELFKRLSDNLRNLQISLANWNQLDCVLSCKNIRKLHLASSKLPEKDHIRCLEQLTAIEEFRLDLRALDVPGQHVIDFNSKLLEDSWQQLATLTVIGPSLGLETILNLNFDIKTGVKKLQVLRLHHCVINGLLSCPESWSLLSDLNTLSFVDTGFPDADSSHILKQIGYLPNLESVEMICCNLRKIDYGSLFLTENRNIFRQLTSLDLSANYLGPFLELNETFKVHSNLKKLVLNSCGLSALPHEAWTFLPSLEELQLCNNHLVDLPMELLKMPKLSILKASGNDFPMLPRCLLYPPVVSRLRLLDLSGCDCLEVAAPIKGFHDKHPFLASVNLSKGSNVPCHNNTDRWITQLRVEFEDSLSADGKQRKLEWRSDS